MVLFFILRFAYTAANNLDFYFGYAILTFPKEIILCLKANYVCFPYRRNLVRVFPYEWTLPWMRPAETEKKKQNSGK